MNLVRPEQKANTPLPPSRLTKFIILDILKEQIKWR